MIQEQERFTVLVTGANSGLGLAICRRLIDEFLHTRPRSQTLYLIPTTRSRTKCEYTLPTLEEHLKKAAQRLNKSLPAVAPSLERRVSICPEIVDLNSLRSVRDLARRLRDNPDIADIDVLVFNAGIGGWAGVNWATAIWSLMTDWTQALTWPSFKRPATGSVTKPQLPSVVREEQGIEEPPLGEIFCANVFGHYVLGHELAGLLRGAEGGRLIWVSSIEAYAHALHFGTSYRDLQAIHNPLGYESSKRLTDLLALTSRLPSTLPWTRKYYTPPTNQTDSDVTEITPANTPKMYVCHPGVCATSIFSLPWILTQVMLLTFYLARILGSMWHTCTADAGACAPVWLALASAEILDQLENKDGVSKWGSAVTAGGEERVERTEVEGWGYGGVIGDARSGKGFKRGRRRGVKEMTAGDREAFEELGRDCWSEIEKLRMEWQERLDAAGV